MKARQTSRTSRRARSVVLVFGESINDARAVASLIEALCPTVSGRVHARLRPTSLQKSASSSKVRTWLSQLQGAVAAYSAPVECVFVHRDADGPDPVGTLERQTSDALRRTGMRSAWAVVPVEEIEAWWLLFPKATEGAKKSWSGALSANPGNVDAIRDPKGRLRRQTARKSVKAAYTEADSPRIAEYVGAAIEAGKGPSGNSASFGRFRSSVNRCCRSADGRQ